MKSGWLVTLSVAGCVAIGLFIRITPSTGDPRYKLGDVQPALSALVDDHGDVSKAMDAAGLDQVSVDGTRDCMFGLWVCVDGRVTGFPAGSSPAREPEPYHAYLYQRDLPDPASVAPECCVNSHAYDDYRDLAAGLEFSIVREKDASGVAAKITVFVNVDKDAYDAPTVAAAVRSNAIAAIKAIEVANGRGERNQVEIENRAKRAKSWDL